MRDEIHTQGFEDYWSILKHMLYEVFHHIDEAYLPCCLNEFRLSRRPKSVAERFDSLLDLMRGGCYGTVGRRSRRIRTLGRARQPCYRLIERQWEQRDRRILVALLVLYYHAAVATVVSAVRAGMCGLSLVIGGGATRLVSRLDILKSPHR